MDELKEKFVTFKKKSNYLTFFSETVNFIKIGVNYFFEPELAARSGAGQGWTGSTTLRIYMYIYSLLLD